MLVFVQQESRTASIITHACWLGLSKTGKLMNSDFRISVDFFDHPKTRLLSAQLGADGVIALERLWCWCATNSIDGWLPPDQTEIEQIARWKGEPGSLVECLIILCLIDCIETDYRVHDWAIHQPYCSAAQARIEQSRAAGKASAKIRKAKFGTAQPPGGRQTQSEASKPESAKDRTASSKNHRTASSKDRSPNPTQPSPTQPNLKNQLSGVGAIEENKNSPRSKSDRGAA
jgi:hypothetical protein